MRGLQLHTPLPPSTGLGNQLGKHKLRILFSVERNSRGGGEVEESKGGVNGDGRRLDNTVYMCYRIVHLNLYNFINQYYPNNFLNFNLI